MRVAHVVNIVDEVGSYGGPLRVAMNQVAALTGLGHEATMLAGGTGVVLSRPEGITGTVTTVLRRSWNIGRKPGFATRWSPGVHVWLLRHARGLDAVQVHLGRDLTTAPAAALLRLMRVRYVVQTHGMVDVSHRRLAWVLDALLVRFALGGAARVFVLTEKERDDVTTVARGRDLPFTIVPNGVPTRAVEAASQPASQPASEMASGPQSEPAQDVIPEVLFLSRLHARKRPVAFVRAAATLRAAGVKARFTVVGPDEGELAGVLEAIERAADPQGWIGYAGTAPMAGSVDRIAAASIFVLPSVAEPFPMAVVEAMSAGVAVVCSASCGLAPLVAGSGAGIVVADDDVAELTAAVETLIADVERRLECGRRGRELVAGTLSIDVVAGQLVAAYADTR